MNQSHYFFMFALPPAGHTTAQFEAIISAINNRVITIPDPSPTPAGYTYFGQLVDHDITHMGHLEELPGEQIKPVGTLEQLSSAMLDLCSIYGTGLNDENVPYTRQGHFYSQFCDGQGLLYDLPRGSLRSPFEARIAECHNDENFIVAQMQVLFMNFHNKLMAHYTGQIPDMEACFRHVRQEVVLVFQKILVEDFLFRFLDEACYRYYFGEVSTSADFGGSTQEWVLEDSRQGMPLEFAAAAFRFGHSLVRGSYALNDKHDLPLSLKSLFGLTGKGGLRHPVTGEAGTDLEEYAIDWKYFFNLDNENYANAFSIKAKLADQLRNLVNESPGNQDLMLRNLLRGKELGLPSAQAIAGQLVVQFPGLCQAINFAPLGRQKLASHDLGEVLSSVGLLDNTPLWLYILMEPAFNNSRHTRLGKLGSIIIAETFRLLLARSPVSISKLSGASLNHFQFLAESKANPMKRLLYFVSNTQN